MSSFLYRLGRACYRLRGRVLIGWTVVIVLFAGLALTIGGHFNDTFEVPGASSTKALNQLKVTFPEAADATATVLITAPSGAKLEDRKVKDAIADWSKDVEKVPMVKGVIDPYNENIDGLISDDGASGRAMIRVQGTSSTITDAQREQLTEAAKTLETTLPGSKVLIGGEIFSIHVPRITVVEALGLGVAIIVLVMTLGSLVASMMPVGTAIAGVGIGVLSVQIAAGVISVSSTTLMLAIMLGLAVGIDYALFIISRHRDQLATGMEVEESAARAVGTAGSAVVFAGLTVIIALVGLSIAGLPFLTVMGVFGALTVAFEVLLALTLLPAFMGFAGERLRPKARKVRKARPTSAAAGENAHGFGELVGASSSRPGRWSRSCVVLVGIGALAYPAKDLSMALPDVRALPARHPGPRDLRRDHREVRHRLQRPADHDRRHRRARRPGQGPRRAEGRHRDDARRAHGRRVHAECERRHRHGADHPDHRARRPGHRQPRRAAPRARGRVEAAPTT